MKKSKYLLSVLAILLVVLKLDVNADTSIAKENNYNVKKGEELTLLVDFDPNNNENYDYNAKLTYDANVIESLSINNFYNTDFSSNNISDIKYDEDNNKFILINNKDSSKKDVLEITIKIKEDVKVKKTTLLFSNITSNIGNEFNRLENIEYNLNITNATNSNNSTYHYISICFLLVAAAFALLLIYHIIRCNKKKRIISEKRENKRKKITIILSSCLLLCLVASLVLYLFYDNQYKKDNVNYFLDLVNTDNNIEDDNQNNPNDGKDEVRIVKTVTSNYYPKKNETIKLSFEINSNVNEEIKSLTINGKEYQTKKTNDGKYEINYKVSDKSGIETIKVNSVNFTDKSIFTDYNMSIDILKEKPTISDFKYDNSKEKPSISFNLNGNDSFVSGTVKIIDNDGKEILTEKIQNGKNNYNLDITNNGTYKVIIEAEYDLDTNKLNYITGNLNTRKENLLTKNIEVVSNYGLKFSQFKLNGIDKDEKIVTLEFTSTNDKNYDISKVVINNKEYEVTKTKDKYLVKVKLDEIAKTTLRIEEVILTDGKRLSDGVSGEVIVFKNAPTVKDVKINVDSDKKDVEVSYEIIDEDKVLEKQYVTLKDSKGNVIETKTLAKDEKKVIFQNVSEKGDYIVEIKGDYDLVDGKTHNKETIISKEFKIELKVSITNVEVSKKYPSKGEEIVVKYTIDANTSQKIDSLTINGEDYLVSLPDGNIYMVVYKVKDEAGLEEITLTNVKIGTDNADTKISTEVDVLKDVPTIDSYIFDDEKEIPELSFVINDNDNAFVSGKIIITDSLGNKVQEQIVNKDKTTYKIDNLKDETSYNFVIEIDYDLDSDNKNNLNETKANLINGVIEVVHEYNFTFDNLEISSIVKNENKVTLQFESKNDTVFAIDRVVINGKDYNVVKNGDIYTVEVVLEESKETKLTITNAVLKNGHSVEINENNSVTVFKNAPSVENLKLSNKDNNTLNVQFTLNDESNTVTKLYVELRDSLGNILQTKELNTTDRETSFAGLEVGEYQVAILADYDLIDGFNYNKHLLKIEKTHIEIVLSELKGEASDKYPARNTEITLLYEIDANTKEQVKKLVINGEEYEPILLDNGKYQVKYTTKDSAGIEKITVEKIIYETENLEISNSDDKIIPTIEIDILKRRPYITNYKADVDYDNKAITLKFDLIDPDNALIKDEFGNLIDTYATFGNFKDKDGNSAPKMKLGHNEITFYNMPEGKIFLFRPVATFDLDSIVDDNNYYSKNGLGGWSAVLVPETSVNVHNLKTYNGSNETKYFEKNEEVTLSFDALSIHPSGDTSLFYPYSIMVDGKEYVLTRDNNNYKAVLPGYDNAGEKEIVIESVILNNKEEILLAENDSIKIDVLKEHVTITDFSYIENKIFESNLIITLNFNLNDLDDALKNSKIVVTDSSNNTVAIAPSNLVKGENKIIFTATSKDIYTIKITASYDRDSLEGSDNLIENKELLSQTIQVLTDEDYNLKVENFKVEQVDLANNIVTVRFDSTNAKEYLVNKVKINGKVLPTRKDGDSYLVDFEVSNTNRLELKLESVTLENEKEFTCDDSVIVFKKQPVITDMEINNESGNKLEVTFDLTDEDNTLSGLYAILKDNNDTILKEEILKPTDRKVTFSDLTARNYVVEILGDYDLTDGKNHSRELLKNVSSSVKPVVSITTKSISNIYPNKNDSIDIIYNIISNTGELVTSLVINNVSYNVENVGTGLYKLTCTAPNASGITSLNVTKVNFATGIVADLTENTHTDKIDVLKSAPTIENFTSRDDLENDMVIFNFTVNDKDNAFVSGKVCVENDCRDANSGLNSQMFKVEKNITHNLLITIEYDLDTDQLDNSEDLHTSSLTFSQNFRLLENYELQINNLKTYKEKTGENTKYFAKGETVELRFNSKNLTNLTISGIKINDKSDNSSDGEWYEVKSVTKEDGTIDYYYVLINSKNEAGLQNINIAAVTLSSGKTIESQEFKEEVKQVQIDILKDVPTIENFAITNNEYDVTISFKLIDNDSALVDSYVKIVDKDGKIVKNEKIVKGDNNITTTLDPDNKYTLTIEKNYNLDSLDNDNLYEKDELYLTQNLEVTKKSEPNFIARHLMVPKRVPDGSKVLLTFENEVMSYEDVTKIRIDGIDYDVTKDGNVYKLELGPIKKGYNTIHVESVVMGNKSFKVNRNLTYIYENIVPTLEFASDIEEDLVNDQGVVDFKINDPDNSITALTAYMRNSSGALVTTQPIPTDSASVIMPLLRTYRYTIELKASYDIGDGKTIETTTIFNKEKVSNPRVNIIEEYTETEIVNKKENMVLIYKINTNIDQELRRIFINDVSYPAEKLDNNVYKILVPASNKSGIFVQKVEKMQFGNNIYNVTDTNPLMVEIRKDIPTLTQFIVDESSDTISFVINDDDYALVGDLTLTISDGNEVITRSLTHGGGLYTYKISELGLNIGTDYNVAVNASYNLRTFKARSNEGTDVEIFNKNIKLIGDVDYQTTFEIFYDYYLVSVKEELPITFKSSNAFGYKVSKIIIDGKEYPVTWRGEDKYNVYYKAEDYSVENMVIEKIILENDAAFEVNREIYVSVARNEAVVEVTNVEEDIENQKVKFYFNLLDDDKTVVDKLKFTLKNSEGKVIDTKYISTENQYVEFDIPNPPTAKYKLEVYADIYLISTLIQRDTRLHTGEYDSVVNTSILDSILSTNYPKKGEIISIEYVISSSKVVTVDVEDHENLDKAVNITSITINGKDYNVELQDNGHYKVYYTVQKEDGIEEIKVTKVNFSNDTTELFTRVDTVDVLKEEPTIINYKTENDLENGKVKFSFEVVDNDKVLANNSIYALVNGEKQYLNVGKNTIEFSVNYEELLNFSIKADYDLDSNLLNDSLGDQNVYKDHTIFERPFILTGDYNLTFESIETISDNGSVNKYFEKGEDIKAKIKITSKTLLYPTSIKIGGIDYLLTKSTDEEDTYYVTINGYKNYGIVNAKIDSLTLNSGNTTEVNDKYISFEILKDIVKVDNLQHKQLEENADKMELEIDISDADSSYESVKLLIKDEYGNNVSLSNTNLALGKNKVTFTKTNANKYFVTINATYDRDTNKFDSESNHYENVRIYYEVITTTDRHIEMKDIVDVSLYNYGSDGSVQKIDSLSIDDLDVITNSLVKVTMKDLPTFYSEIKSYRVEEGKLTLVLAYSDAMIYTNGQLIPLEVTLDILEDSSYEYSGSFKSLVEKMKENPTGTFILNKDYDLDDYNTDTTTLIDFEFNGVLDGNGHTISNIHKPLFKTLKNAEIKNLIFKGAEFPLAREKAVITIDADNTKFTNVHIDGVTITVNGDLKDNNATFAVRLKNNSIIQNCSAVNINFYTNYLAQYVSGMVSRMTNSKIINSYVQGKITSGWQFTAGIASVADKDSEISNNIVNMVIDPYFGEYTQGGIVAAPNGVTLKNNLSLIDQSSKIYTIYQANNKISDNSINNYQLKESKAKKNEGLGIETISKNEINDAFFQKLGFDPEIWNIENTSFDNLPTLKGLTASFSDKGEKPEHSNVYIPDYNRLSHLEAYEKEREIIYHNMYKLMPFYDAKEILTDGNKLALDSNFNKKVIDYVLPYDKNGKLVSVLTNENYKDLGKISVIFEDGTEEEYTIDFDDYYGNVVSYIVSDLNIGYNYNKFVIDKNASIIKTLYDLAASYDYDKDLDSVTKAEDSRLYREFYNQENKNNILEFIEKALVNSGYMPTFNSDVLDNLILQNLVDTDKLKEMLYAYNYYKYWYDIDMDGVNMADSIMFHGDEMFDSRMTLATLSTALKDSGAATNATANFYNNIMSNYTEKKNLGEFFEYYILNLTDYKSGNEWFINNFHGGILEQVDIGYSDTYYTFWDHFMNSGNVQNTFLPLLTVPENSMYVITSPTQVFYGSLRIYVKDPNNKEEIDKFYEEKLNKTLREIKNFYIFAHDYVGAANMNPYHDIEYDIRSTYDENGIVVYNNPGQTKEAYHKYFAEAVNKWPASNGSGAYATGSEVYWNVIKLIGSFNVATHETLHNQDSKVFLMGYGRRGDGEDYTAGNLQQYYNDGWISPNVMQDFDMNANITQNFTYERINTDEELQDFYQKYFEANDFLDYIEAQAFLQLSPEEQAKIAVQVYYPNKEGLSDEEKEKGDSTVGYRLMNADTIKAMNLTKVEDLWDNHIMIRPGTKKDTIIGPGASTDSLYNIHWYQPHADDSRPDGPNFKWLAWEMASVGGYYKGYMAYFSQSYIGMNTNRPTLKTTDLIALRYITSDDDITFREFKLNKYKNVAEKWNNDDYVDADAIYQEYLAALTQDAKNNDRNVSLSTAVKKRNFMNLKRATNDFTASIFDIPTSSNTENTAN